MIKIPDEITNEFIDRAIREYDPAKIKVGEHSFKFFIRIGTKEFDAKHIIKKAYFLQTGKHLRYNSGGKTTVAFLESRGYTVINRSMDINKIAATLNELAAKHSHAINELQTLRKDAKGLSKPKTYQLFDLANSVFDKDDIYAFHSGGRSELQFNIGEEWINKKPIFRYGFGFSLEPNRNLPDPVNVIVPKIERYNTFVRSNPKSFQGLSMWFYSNGKRSRNFPAGPIPKEWIKEKNFIAVGNYFDKAADQINKDNLNNILKTFNELLPAYKYIELKHNLQNKSKYARLTWNTNGWVKPSGKNGKSKSPEMHEGKYGYGHEEWLCDTSKILDGYHYAFLEPIRKGQKKHTGKIYDVDLYTLDGVNKKRFYVGKINNVEVLTEDLGAYAKKKYIEQGWLKEMEAQIKECGANNKGFSDWKGVDLFNIRFKVQDLHILPDYVEVLKSDKIHDLDRYTFAKKINTPKLKAPLTGGFTFNPTTFEEEEVPKKKKGTYVSEPRQIEITYLHREISEKLGRSLSDIYGIDNISLENPSGKGTLIDLVRKENSDFVFYEIKTYPSLKACIREALGQIIEYSYWPTGVQAKELIIVSQHKVDNNTKEYMTNLRAQLNLPIFYQHFDLDNLILSEKY